MKVGQVGLHLFGEESVVGGWTHQRFKGTKRVDWKSLKCLILMKYWLMVEPPIWKICSSKWETIFPKFSGLKIKKCLSCHHLGITSQMSKTWIKMGFTNAGKSWKLPSFGFDGLIFLGKKRPLRRLGTYSCDKIADFGQFRLPNYLMVDYRKCFRNSSPGILITKWAPKSAPFNVQSYPTKATSPTERTGKIRLWGITVVKNSFRGQVFFWGVDEGLPGFPWSLEIELLISKVL